MPVNELDRVLIERIRAGEATAWEELIARFEGRLLAYVNSRLTNRSASEDIVQNTFMGFLISLPNFDERLPLENFLFTVAAHKLTDHFRKEGRRPTIPLSVPNSQGTSPEPPGDARHASSLVRSQERQGTESTMIAQCLSEQIQSWKENGETERLKCLELLFVLGYKNKKVAIALGMTEQAVANHKHAFIAKLKQSAKQARINDFDPEQFGID